MRKGLVQAVADDHTCILSMEDVLAVEIGEEKEVAAVGATLGRMALTGLGVAMFTGGRGSGTGAGAGLLDLSLRGAVKKNAAAGVMIWPDTTILSFSVQGQEIEQLTRVVPQEAFAKEHLQEARSRLDLLERMRLDGKRALVELAQEIAQVSTRVADLHSQAEQAASFGQRDAIRQEALELQEKLTTMRILCGALQADLSISARELTTMVPDFPVALPAPEQTGNPRGELSTTLVKPTIPAKFWTRGRLIALAVVLVILWVLFQF